MGEADDRDGPSGLGPAPAIAGEANMRAAIRARLFGGESGSAEETVPADDGAPDRTSTAPETGDEVERLDCNRARARLNPASQLGVCGVLLGTLAAIEFPEGGVALPRRSAQGDKVSGYFVAGRMVGQLKNPPLRLGDALA